MKKVAVIASVVIILLIGFLLAKSRFGRSMNKNGGDLVILNNTAESASSAFTKDGKMMSEVVQPGERTSGGRGLIRIFSSKKSGAYEIQYPFPRPSGQPMEISLTQVFDSVHNPSTGDELITEKGMIGDIKVSYEEVRDLDAVY